MVATHGKAVHRCRLVALSRRETRSIRLPRFTAKRNSVEEGEGAVPMGHSR